MNENVVVFTGYLAEMIRLQAEKKGMTPEAYVLSFFDRGCNAPNPVAGRAEGSVSRKKSAVRGKKNFIYR